VSPLLIEHCALFDPRRGAYVHDQHVLVEGGFVREVSSRPIRATAARRCDAAGLYVLPGLIDAHFHACGADLDVARVDAMPRSLLAQYARGALEAALARGFTTVRDAAGADVGLRIAIEQGLIRGPRLFHSGRAISQTGGHGDSRAPSELAMCGCVAGGTFVVADGVDAVRRAAREELRRGATQLKVFLSGGVLSPGDPLDRPQLADDELATVVAEAHARGTYVMAHAHTADAVRRCIAHGVRSIEHATLVDRPTATAAAAAGVFVTPTLAVLEALADPALPLAPAMRDKAVAVHNGAMLGFEALAAASVALGFGTDLLGPLMKRQGREFVLRAEVVGAAAALTSATLINARMLDCEGALGEIVPGAHADLVALDRDPLRDVSVLGDPARVRLLVKAGDVLQAP
jgi:imidazolonepropionase-like amidohydrolase